MIAPRTELTHVLKAPDASHYVFIGIAAVDDGFAPMEIELNAHDYETTLIQRMQGKQPDQQKAIHDAWFAELCARVLETDNTP